MRATHRLQSHRRPSGYRSSIFSLTESSLASDSGKLASAHPSAPYPSGNGTVLGHTGIGAVSTSTTITMTVQSTVYIASFWENVSTSSANGAGGLDRPARSSSTVPDFESSAILGGTGEEASACGALATVTVTQGTTVTITIAESPSQNSPISQFTSLSQVSVQHQASVHSQAQDTPKSQDAIDVSSSKTSLGPAASDAEVPERLATSPASLTGHATSQHVELTTVPSSSTSIASGTASASLASTASSPNTLTPNGIKAGVAGYRSITEKSSWSQFTSQIGWYSDYWPDTPDSGTVSGIGMVSPLPRHRSNGQGLSC